MFREILKKIYGEAIFYPRKYQLAFAEVLDEIIVNEISKPIFVRLPCGYGKTLMGLLPFIGQHLAGGYPLSPRLIYVLPTRSLVNFFAKTAKQLMEKVGLRGVNVAIQHGETHTSPHYLSEFTVTTLDTFFYVYVKKAVVDNHLEFPAGCIATSTIVFDEAHMYQGGEGLTFIALRKLIQHLIEAGIPVIIMTATMPEKLEKYLLIYVVNLPIEYGSSEIGIDEKYESSEGRKEYNVEIRDEVDITNTVKNYKRTLIVFNTVSRAQKTYYELRNKFDNVILLHSRICRIIREEYEGRIHDLINRGGNVIIVSTQVCESGLDFNAEILITEAAPSDALTQRIGRCARKGGYGEVIIVKPKTSHPYKEQYVSTSIEYLKEMPKKARGIIFSNFIENVKFINLMDYTPREENRMAMELKTFMDEWLKVAETPPENLDLKIRETNFVSILHLIDDELYNEIINALSHEKKTSLAKLNSSIEYFRNHLKNHTFTLDMNILFEHKDGEKTVKSFLLHEVNGEKFIVKISNEISENGRNNYFFTKINPNQRIIPYNMYLINNRYCDDEVGLHDLQ